MRRLNLSRWAPAVVLAGVAGCSCCHKRSTCPPPPPPIQGCPAPAPAVVFPAPMGGPAPAPVSGLPPAPAPIQPPPAGQVGGYEPAGVQQGSYYWRPADGGSGVALAPPVPYGKDKEPPRVTDSVPKPMPKVIEGAKDGREAAPIFPVGIPQFAVAQENVASGLRPSLEGLDWLRDNGYKTVLHVHPPGEDDSADQKQVTKRGLQFVSLEASPQTLTPKLLEEFKRIVEDSKGYKLFVYDKDGMVAGGLWYLYFRTVKVDPADTARMKAARLGLGEDQEGDHKDMWVAIQKFLSEQQP